MKRKPRMLIVDDESSITDALELIMRENGYDALSAGSAAEAVALLRDSPFDVVFTDLKLPDADGIELLAKIKESAPATEVILMTAHGSLEVTIDAIKKGAYYYIEKPFTPDQAIMLAARALELARVREENRELRGARQSDTFGMVGRAPQMMRIYDTIRATAASEASVLIEGESGTGKELIASAFHSQSNRADGPFVRINCAAIPRDLIESELFGYKKGAFTGADRDKRGLIEAASGGTLLLDEIVEMPAHLQTKLLRVLQDRRLRRVGSEQEIGVDFRLVSATNRNTAQAINEGTLREDLYFRISTIKVRVPPLRDRGDDLILLAKIFLQCYAGKYDKPIQNISPAALALLSRYEWPGNVRELESVIERAVLFCQEATVTPEHLPDHVSSKLTNSFRCEIPPFLTMEEIEREA
ncbi:MAG TPA: sigma-54 dependent transcriptional regulator, partial [Blastocatellia bacterium]